MLSIEQVTALAPDPASLKAGQGLANARKWVSIGGAENAIWGECQGSAADPYMTQVELDGLTTKCTCPSRKFPCKHALGLMLMAVKEPKLMSGATVPEWVQEWLGKRAEKEAKKTAKAEAIASKEVTPESLAEAAAAAEKRTKNREEKIKAGLEEMELWIADLVRVGLAGCQKQGGAFWSGKAARLVDAQAKGLANQVEDLASVVVSGTGWQERLLERLSLLNLLCTAYRNIATSSEGQQADVRRYVGWTVKQEDVFDRRFLEVNDTWRVLGQTLDVDDQLTTLKTWLHGAKSGRFASVLTFAVARQPLEMWALPGTEFTATLSYYASAIPLRAILRERGSDTVRPLKVDDSATPINGITLHEGLRGYALGLAEDPWLMGYPMLLKGVRVWQSDKGWLLEEADSGFTLPIERNCTFPWRLLSISGGHPVTIFGEWSGTTFLPVSAISSGRYMHLDQGKPVEVAR